jgi:uncharacterized protein YjbI with pentapeptide repeats
MRSKKLFLIFLFITYLNGVVFSQWPNHTFTDSINFSKRILFDSDFSYATFSKDVSFFNSSFSRNTYFIATIFSNNVNFFETEFLKNVGFDNSEFLGNVYFSYSTFRQDADFKSTAFYKNAVFKQCSFNKSNFSNSIFYQDGDFSGVDFVRNAYFNHVQLKSNATLIFDDSQLPDTLYFCNIYHIPNEIDLTTAKFEQCNCCTTEGNKYHYIDLFKSDISKFKLDYTHFKLCFNCPDSSGEIPRDAKIEMYKALLNNFQNHKQNDDYDKLYNEYLNFRVTSDKWYLTFPDLFLVSIYINFPHNPILSTFNIYLILSLLTFWFLNYLNTYVYEIPIISRSFSKAIKPRPYKLYDSIVKMWNAFIYTAILFFPLSIKQNNFKFENFFRPNGKISIRFCVSFCYILSVYGMGLLCIYYIANHFFHN